MKKFPSKEELAAAITTALETYDDDRAWATGVLAVEYDEAGGYMGSAPAYKAIDHDEFAGRVLEALQKNG